MHPRQQRPRALDRFRRPGPPPLEAAPTAARRRGLCLPEV